MRAVVHMKIDSEYIGDLCCRLDLGFETSKSEEELMQKANTPEFKKFLMGLIALDEDTRPEDLTIITREQYLAETEEDPDEPD